MTWLKAEAAAREWCGGISPKVLYGAVRAGKLKAARIGAGRNLLFAREWCDEWLMSSAMPRTVDLSNLDESSHRA